jgi:hypothetical protein
MTTPARGIKLSRGIGSTGLPGTGRSSNRRDNVAKRTMLSIVANRKPMQRRGPPPNGKNA